jgi:hypothetical protein
VGAVLLALGAAAGMLPAAGPGAGSALLRLVAAGALIAAAGLVLPYVARRLPFLLGQQGMVRAGRRPQTVLGCLVGRGWPLAVAAFLSLACAIICWRRLRHLPPCQDPEPSLASGTVRPWPDPAAGGPATPGPRSGLGGSGRRGGHTETAGGAAPPICPGTRSRPRPPSSRRNPVGLLWAARVAITPGHGQSRTNRSRIVPADLKHPREKGSSDPCPCAHPGSEPLMRDGFLRPPPG